MVWAPKDRVMPREHGRRLAGLFPDGRLVEIPDSYTLIPEDQPAMLAAYPREFLPTSAWGAGTTLARNARLEGHAKGAGMTNGPAAKYGQTMGALHAQW